MTHLSSEQNGTKKLSFIAYYSFALGFNIPQNVFETEKKPTNPTNDENNSTTKGKNSRSI